MNTVSRKTGEGRVEFSRTWGPDFDQKGGEGGKRTGGAGLFVRGNYKYYIDNNSGTVSNINLYKPKI